MRRVHTAVPGLDRLLQGGFPDGSTILVRGPAGVGKTLLGLQFLHAGVTQYNEPGVLIQAGDFGTTLYWYEEMLGYKFSDLQQRGKLVIYSFKPKDYEKFDPIKIQGEFLGKLKNIIDPMGTRRVVIDSISPLTERLDKQAQRRSLYETLEFFKDNKITALAISEDGDAEEHMFDGVIKLRHVENPDGLFRKQLMVSKMVATDFPMAWYPAAISERGLSVRPFQ